MSFCLKGTLGTSDGVDFTHGMHLLHRAHLLLWRHI